MTLQVVDREGRRVADQPIGLVRPEGPLASLWPAGLRTDPAGTLTLRGLEAGRHTLLIGEGKERREIVVPAAGESEARPAVERIVVPRLDHEGGEPPGTGDAGRGQGAVPTACTTSSASSCDKLKAVFKYSTTFALSGA